MSLNKTAPYDRLFKHFGIAESVEWFRYTTLLNVEFWRSRWGWRAVSSLRNLCVPLRPLRWMCAEPVYRRGRRGPQRFRREVLETRHPRFSWHKHRPRL